MNYWKGSKIVDSFVHEEASRKNIPTAEYQAIMKGEEQTPLRIAYERRNRDLDPQLVWRGKDEQDWSEWPRWPSGRDYAARCSAMISIRLMASSSTPIFSGAPPAATSMMATAITSLASQSRSRPCTAASPSTGPCARTSAPACG